MLISSFLPDALLFSFGGFFEMHFDPFKRPRCLLAIPLGLLIVPAEFGVETNFALILCQKAFADAAFAKPAKAASFSQLTLGSASKQCQAWAMTSLWRSMRLMVVVVVRTFTGVLDGLIQLVLQLPARGGSV